MEETSNRKLGTRKDGSLFDEATIEAVWIKGVPAQEVDSLRKDRYGALMARSEYGETTRHGWEIDHIIPVSKGGTDSLSNLQPLHWENNRCKSDNLLDLDREESRIPHDTHGTDRPSS